MCVGDQRAALEVHPNHALSPPTVTTTWYGKFHLALPTTRHNSTNIFFNCVVGIRAQGPRLAVQCSAYWSASTLLGGGVAPSQRALLTLSCPSVPQLLAMISLLSSS